MSNVFIESAYLTSIASAIRDKLGVSDRYKPSQMASAIMSISSGSAGSIEQAFLLRTITEYSNSEISSLGEYAFACCSALASVSLPALTSIGSYAFRQCESLSSVSFSAVTNVEHAAFATCTSLTSVSLPAATNIGSGAFQFCYSLPSISFPAATTISHDAFGWCSSLTTVSLPNVTFVGGAAFDRCRSLLSISLPAVTTIQAYAFFSCTNLMSLYITTSSVPALLSTDAFTGTPLEASYSGTYGSIYVKSSLLSAFKAAENWSYYSDRMVGI